MMTKWSLIAAMVLGGALASCTGQSPSTDDSMYLTGTEEDAVTALNGQVTCTNPHKVLICHIPPGNPANEHSICVGQSAVAPHQQQHGDGLGACGGTVPPDDGGVGSDTGSGDGSGDGTGSGGGSGGGSGSGSGVVG